MGNTQNSVLVLVQIQKPPTIEEDHEGEILESSGPSEAQQITKNNQTNKQQSTNKQTTIGKQFLVQK